MKPSRVRKAYWLVGELGRPFALRGDDTVVDEVTLVRTRIVVTGGESTYAVLEELGVVDALVYPVPDTSTDTYRGFFENIPVFAEIAHAVTHGVVIFAHEVGLTGSVGALFVGSLRHLPHVRIHPTVEVGDASRVTTSVGGSFVVDGTCIERAHSVVSGDEVVACATFVTQRPEDDAGMVAVAQYHAFGAVNHHGLPSGTTRDDLVVVTLASSVVIPVFVTFEVGFVHDVKTIVVEHGIHLGLARIV